jgi:hypothetical protein
MVPELVNHRNLVHARNRAKRRTPLYRIKFPVKIFRAILLKGNTRRTALLRAIMDESILADVEISASGTAFPVIRISLYKVLLKLVVIGKVEKDLPPISTIS